MRSKIMMYCQLHITTDTDNETKAYENSSIKSHIKFKRRYSISCMIHHFILVVHQILKKDKMIHHA